MKEKKSALGWSYICTHNIVLFLRSRISGSLRAYVIIVLSLSRRIVGWLVNGSQIGWATLYVHEKCVAQVAQRGYLIRSSDMHFWAQQQFRPHYMNEKSQRLNAKRSRRHLKSHKLDIITSGGGRPAAQQSWSKRFSLYWFSIIAYVCDDYEFFSIVDRLSSSSSSSSCDHPSVAHDIQNTDLRPGLQVLRLWLKVIKNRVRPFVDCISHSRNPNQLTRTPSSVILNDFDKAESPSAWFVGCPCILWLVEHVSRPLA